MSLPSSVIKALQQAGQSVHSAGEALGQAVQSNSLQMVATLARDPFSPQGEWEFTRLRSMARLGHELQAVEGKLRELYEQAQKLMQAEEPMLVTLAPPESSDADSIKSTAKQEAAPVATELRGKQKGTQKAAKAVSHTKGQPKSAKPLKMSPNDSKLLAGLKKTLDRKGWKRLTHGAMAQAAGLPSGSVGLSLKRLMEMGQLVMNADGAYRLGQAK